MGKYKEEYRRTDDVVDEAILDRVAILRRLYWYESWKSWQCRKSITDTESRACKHQVQLCWGYRRGIKLVELWRTRDIDLQWHWCHTELCWPERGWVTERTMRKVLAGAVLPSADSVAGTRENLKTFTGERKQGQLLGDKWVIGERHVPMLS